MTLAGARGVKDEDVDWFLSIIDRLCAAVWVAVFALAASQVEPLTQQYSANTAKLLAQAEAHLKDVQTGARYETMAETVRAELETEARTALAQKQEIHDAVANAVPILRPFGLWRLADRDVLSDTWASFVPALPASGWAIADTIIGLLLGFGCYELVKWPTIWLLRAPPRRRFKKRTNLG